MISLQILLFDVIIFLTMIYEGTQKTVKMMEFLISHPFINVKYTKVVSPAKLYILCSLRCPCFCGERGDKAC